MLKPELQAKFIQHLSNRKNREEEGFTLIELLVVVIIIGVLAAIALPSLLGQVNKAKQSEARTYVGTVNRSQQAFYLEYTKFATSLNDLQVGIKSQTDNFKYDIKAKTPASGGGPVQFFANVADDKKGLKNYYGLVGTIESSSETKEALTLALACESKKPVDGGEDGKVPDETQKTFDKDTVCNTEYTSLAR